MKKCEGENFFENVSLTVAEGMPRIASPYLTSRCVGSRPTRLLPPVWGTTMFLHSLPQPHHCFISSANSFLAQIFLPLSAFLATPRAIANDLLLVVG